MKDTGGTGKLIKNAAKRIQGHYRGALRQNIGNLEKMKKTIWAICIIGIVIMRNVVKIAGLIDLIKIGCLVL